jgi:hypothetical protein
MQVDISVGDLTQSVVIAALSFPSPQVVRALVEQCGALPMGGAGYGELATCRWTLSGGDLTQSVVIAALSFPSPAGMSALRDSAANLPDHAVEPATCE